MANILCIGTVTLDIINQVPRYPGEDEEMRILQQQHRRGGNAANTAAVLAQLGHQPEFLGSIAKDESGQWIRRQLAEEKVHSPYCPHVEGTTPTSYITLNQQTGARSILHYRDLPELPDNALAPLPLDTFDWFHFEARNINAVESMLHHLQQHSGTGQVSLEVEKSRPGVEKLFSKVPYLFFSRGYAQSQGYRSAALFLRDLHPSCPNTFMSCSWGARGSWGISPHHGVSHHPAVRNSAVVDTIGAGDTFNAGMIDQLIAGRSFTHAMRFASTLAGIKVTQPGFKGLGEKINPADR